MSVSAWLKTAGGATLLLAFAAPAVSADPVSVVDVTGRTIELASPAERVVTFPVPSASVVIALDGGTSRLAGIHPESKLAIEDGILGAFFPEAKDIPSDILAEGAKRGTRPDIARVKALSPDFIVQWEHAGDNARALIDAGLPTGLLVFGTEDNIRNAIAMIGTAIGREDKVEMLMAWRDDTSASIEEGLAEFPPEAPPKVAYFFYALTDLHTEGTGTYADWQIRHLGAENVASGMEGWGKVDAAEVARWNPDIIFIGNFERGLHPDRIYNDPVLKDTTAAKNRRVYLMPTGGYRWGPGSIESPFTWMWLADLIYPNTFTFDLRAEIADWYPKLYGHTPTKEQVDAILAVGVNAGSANYERFAAQ